MNKENMQLALDTKAIEPLLEQIENIEDLHPSVLLVPDSMSIQSIEDNMVFANRMRAIFCTNNIKSLVAYHKRFDTDGAICCIGPDTLSCKTIFDFGNESMPGHQQNIAMFSAEKTAAYKAVLKASKLSSQKEVSDFFEDWADYLAFIDQSGEGMTALAAAKSIRKLTIESARSVTSEIGDLSNSMSAIEKIEAKQGVSIATTITATVKPSKDLIERDLKIKLSILTSGEKPALSLRIVGLEETQEKIAEELAKLIEDELIETDTKIYIGNI